MLLAAAGIRLFVHHPPVCVAAYSAKDMLPRCPLFVPTSLNAFADSL